MSPTKNTRLDTAKLEALREEIALIPDEVDGLAMVDAKRDADYKLGIAINSLKVLRKISAE